MFNQEKKIFFLLLDLSRGNMIVIEHLNVMQKKRIENFLHHYLSN
jgi:hypothetical protein